MKCVVVSFSSGRYLSHLYFFKQVRDLFLRQFLVSKRDSEGRIWNWWRPC